MCSGKEEKMTQIPSSHWRQGAITCELCNSRATIYCHSDDAFLCRTCDKHVHKANFLALRHIRCVLCESCQQPKHRYIIGSSFELTTPFIGENSIFLSL
ncbi:Zinc finger, B-box [Cinnamomum micranthum f. kanehirae]|uniref:Zinc finger, B-box n=1 Tax=Cinnamomum micranthum f. kanehirae TaxID=337451 RepID=A0A3S4PQA7_9MAGN|nr:Zinc finger, B-box [Cinnamomum micranthum f. kanehirae]